ncbi:hypothetical protein GX50_03119 [[Emmonsia] crescens]|uniref:C6 finger domain transcription factor nscR n=1 Tax=[Emmonsia] crescens TaxID=73230 RepID=A0A2B7ZLK8_9EURO|nr:hypothetical protein GX50_03119 [Emmonsia crescens]
MQTISRKRKVSSCIPCYTRKQKCNRQYPCNNCARRRRPEECVYYPSGTIQSAIPSLKTCEQPEQSGSRRRTGDGAGPISPDMPSDLAIIESPTSNPWPSSLAEVFGYSEDSQTNTMALLRRIDLHEEEENQNGKGQDLSPETVIKVQHNLDRMPDRATLDFLVRYFVAEVNWMDQLVHIPWFLEQYQQWWIVKRPSSAFWIEFAALLLRICSYASQFSPSPSHTIEGIRGMPLGDIRKVCDDVADNLALICAPLNPRGGLIRVQHLAIAGLKSLCEGRANDFRDKMRCAIHAAQRIGMDKDDTPLIPDMDEIEKEMRRRIFCNLYIWDSFVSRQLDRPATLCSYLGPEKMPRMRLGPDVDGTQGLEEFTERILQARLANFWKSTGPNMGSEYDIILAEERYEKLCSDFLATLPSAFALQPDKRWDGRLPMLRQQREILHITIFESLCYNFRPVLLQDLSQVQCLPKYKQALLSSQRKALAVAAQRVLKGTATLHALMGNSQTRFLRIILPTFEAAVLLVNLCMDPDFPRQDETHGPSTIRVDPLGAGMVNLKRDECMQAVSDALKRLQMLAEVSNVAEVGVKTLAQLHRKLMRLSASGSAQGKENDLTLVNDSSTEAGKSSSNMHISQHPDPGSQLRDISTTVTAFDVVNTN